MLHDEETQKWIKEFSKTDEIVLKEIEQNLIDKRMDWFKQNYEKVEKLNGDILEKAYQLLQSCRVCPRRCGSDRLNGERGVCKVGKNPVVSSYNVHLGEEPPISGTGGSGTIFFTSCNAAGLSPCTQMVSAANWISEPSAQTTLPLVTSFNIFSATCW